jgi:hypothetical protein
MKRFITIVLLIMLGAIILGFIFRKGKPAPIKPCTDSACILITQGDGQKYKLNDFRFLPNHCIIFREFDKNLDHKYCGQYKLDWIGETPKGVHYGNI